MQGLAKLGVGHGKGAAHVVCGTLILCLMVTFCAETPQGLAKLVGDMEKALHTLRWCVEPLLLRCHILDAHAHTNKQTPIHTHVLSPAEMLLVSAACVWGVCVYVCVGVYVYVYVYVCVVSVGVSVCVSLFVCEYMCVCVCTCMCVGVGVGVGTVVGTVVYVHVYVYLYVCESECLCVYVYVYV